MLKRKMKGVLIDSSPASYVSAEEAKTRFKHQCLMQDYNDLFRETLEKRKTTQFAKRKRQILLAEVRFLRQRYEELMEYQSREQNSVSCQVPQTRKDALPHAHRDAVPIERGRRDKDTSLPNPPFIDLNQIANDDEEEMEVQNALEPVNMVKNPMKISIYKAGKPPLPPRQKDMKLTVCRDIRKGTNRSGKRKISVHDPMALRV